MATSSYSTDKDVNAFIGKLIRDDGWRFEKGKKHSKVIAPNGKMVSFSVTPSCKFVLKKIKKDCERVLQVSGVLQ